MQKFVSSAAALLAASTLSCSAIRLQSPVAMPSRAPEEVKVGMQGPWWQDSKIVTALALTASQRIYLDAIARRANEEMAWYEHDARLAGSFVDAALDSEPFDGNAFNYVLAEYTARQARLVARDLQRVAEIRNVLTHEQWTAVQNVETERDAALKLQSR